MLEGAISNRTRNKLEIKKCFSKTNMSKRTGHAIYYLGFIIIGLLIAFLIDWLTGIDDTYTWGFLLSTTLFLLAQRMKWLPIPSNEELKDEVYKETKEKINPLHISSQNINRLEKKEEIAQQNRNS